LLLLFKKEDLPSFSGWTLATMWHAEAISFGTALFAYLLGSIPFGLILTRMAGLGDIRNVGSGNIGATNVLRTGRRGLAAGTLLLDGAKGALAVQVVGLVAGARWEPLAAVAVVVGHCFPVWLGFRGGKGVATGLGVLLALDWRVGLAACLIWAVLALVTRLSSGAALSAFALAPVLAAVVSPAGWWVAPAALSLLVWWRHRANIARILAGTEPRIGQKTGAKA
jgi:glycerol-3-phosphate acyltransferase PlsY